MNAPTGSFHVHPRARGRAKPSDNASGTAMHALSNGIINMVKEYINRSVCVET